MIKKIFRPILTLMILAVFVIVFPMIAGATEVEDDPTPPTPTKNNIVVYGITWNSAGFYLKDIKAAKQIFVVSATKKTPAETASGRKVQYINPNFAYWVYDLCPGTTYYVYAMGLVTSEDYTKDDPHSKWSEPITIKTKALPKPTNFKLKAKKGGVKISFTQVAGVSGYNIQYKLSTSKKYKSVNISKSSASKSIAKLKKGKKYKVRIRSYYKTKVNGKTKTYYSAFTKVKTIKTKK